MASNEDGPRGTAVPKSRLGRMARFGGMASGIAGTMLVEGAKTVARGDKLSMQDLLLTPKNAGKVADQLARLRGAAMKMGQIISMDGNDLVPEEFAEVLARLRDGAHSMPPKQLKTVLNDNWGRGWLREFERFDTQPLAAASIGQVHRAKTKDGRDLAIKIQYPGVKESIDSDVDNVSTLLKLSRMLPEGVDLGPLLEEAKAQLHEEADYEAESTHIETFRTLLGADDRFAIPERQEDLTTKNVLAMTYMKGDPIESLIDAPQEERDRVAGLLFELLIRELFEFHVMQTDPNFANYRINRETGQVVLLDFGATRHFTPEHSAGYRRLVQAAIKRDAEGVREAGDAIGILDGSSFETHKDRLMEIVDLSIEPMRAEGPYDFGASDLALRLRDAGVALRAEDDFYHVPSSTTLFLHRKFGGIYLLARRLKARVDVGAMIRPYC